MSSDDNRTDDDRTNAMGLLNFAHSYWEAAVVLHNSPRLATHRDSPCDYLFYHAIELYLKAYLRLKGLTLEQLKEQGHSLQRLHNAAVREGLTDDPEDRDVICAIRDNYMSARYIRTGYFSRPSPEALWGVCRVLHGDIEPVVNAAWNVKRTRHIPYIVDPAEQDEP
ncbi:HEPN domain-containing protein [Cereibacter changlensis]|uniref:HEPN domain-containing protein n=1 Tax=Cereibacter changlensis TaxID=402884 RepID=A0A4U0YYH4_9RHOB|nr:HEPN domain-containing protein [Cereibacter changlensis]TKA95756.1 HEPN domain-containing protein [Cereibacter changlensis]